METISSVAAQAAKAVWGDGSEHREPVSGRQGDVARGEPYDAGNLETRDQQKLEETLARDQAASAPQDKPREDAGREEHSDGPGAETAGAGARPLQVVAKEHGGDAGNVEDPSEPRDKDETHREESKDTGEQYVKTTGFAADGGDFDATKPGAGREADRLLEEKGQGHGAAADKDAPAGGDKDKPGLGERIKNKLHKH